MTSVVSAPAPQSSVYDHEGIAVRRFAAATDLDLDGVYGPGDGVAAAAFGAVLDAERPDVVHQHALTAACSPLLMKAAKDRGIPVVFTYHTPAAACLRGTLLRWGTAPCDGRLEPTRCAACVLDGHHVPRVVGHGLAHVPPVVGTWIGRLGLGGGPWTAVRMSALTRSYQARVRAGLDLADRVVVPADWASTVLRLNGVAEEKLVTSRHGIAGESSIRPRAINRTSRVRLAHLGRVTPEKGTALLVRALTSVPALPVDLDIFGVVQSAADMALKRDLQRLTAADPRVRWLEPLPAGSVVSTLVDYDIVVVPSQWLETGPLVVLEAFAAGVPVLGSRLGGIAEWVAHGRDGWLVDAFDEPAAWATALGRCADREWLEHLAAGVRPPRTAAAVAEDMWRVYDGLQSHRHAGVAAASA